MAGIEYLHNGLLEKDYKYFKKIFRLTSMWTKKSMNETADIGSNDSLCLIFPLDINARACTGQTSTRAG